MAAELMCAVRFHRTIYFSFVFDLIFNKKLLLRYEGMEGLTA